MSRPIWQLLWMLIALLAAGGVAFLLWEPIFVAYSHNPILNTGILAVLLLGILFTIWQVVRLYADISWIEDFRTGNFAQSYSQPRLLAPLAAMLKDKTGRLNINASSLRSVLDGVQSRLDDNREISRYVTSLLIFLGLLGTFWGLLDTVKGVADAIGSLQVGSANDPGVLFDTLKQSLAKPLAGMGIAFSSSLFGLTGSLIIGFLELQAGQAQSRFFNELEDWLSTHARLSSSGFSGFADVGDQPIPAYIQALLEQNAESIGELQRVLQRGEESRNVSVSGFKQLADQLAVLNDQTRDQQQATARLAELAAAGSFGIDPNSRNHLRNLDAHLARLSEELAQGRAQATQELRTEIKLIADQLAVLNDQTRNQLEATARLAELAATGSFGVDPNSRNHLRNLDAHLARLSEELAQGRSHSVQEMRAEIKLIADQLAVLNDQTRNQQEATGRLAELAATGSFGIDTNSRNHLRNLEAHLGRLSEELAQGRSQSLQEMRAEIKQLSDQLAVLNDQTRDQQQATARLVELAAAGSFGIDANSRNHLRNLDAHLARLSADLAHGRSQSTQELRAEIKLLARTIAVAAGTER